MPSKSWFTADTHFSQERTINLSRRPFESINEHDEQLISKWNSVVGPYDIVYHLGDFGDYSISEYLNGNIVLLFGNYERDDGLSAEYLKDNFNFKLVYDQKRMYNTELECYMVHEPSNMEKDNFNLFGHIHRAQMIKRNGLNVGVDCHYYTPIDIEQIEFFRNAILNHYDNEVFL